MLIPQEFGLNFRLHVIKLYNLECDPAAILARQTHSVVMLTAEHKRAI